MTNTAIDMAGVEVLKQRGNARFRLQIPLFRLNRGERVALTGTSGCGKSTLLDTIAMIIQPVRVERFSLYPREGAEIDVASLLQNRRSDRLAEIRSGSVGYVLQTGGLLPFLSVERNIMLTLSLQRYASPDIRETVRIIADDLGIKRHLHKLPADLSVGERQRVAIARAIAPKPMLVLADEPTAALDPANADTVMQLLIEATVTTGAGLIIASHDKSLIERFGFDQIEPSLEFSSNDVISIFRHEEVSKS